MFLQRTTLEHESIFSFIYNNVRQTNEGFEPNHIGYVEIKIYKAESSVWNWVDTVHPSMQSFWASNVYPYSPGVEVMKWSASRFALQFFPCMKVYLQLFYKEEIFFIFFFVFLNINTGLINNLIGLFFWLLHLSKEKNFFRRFGWYSLTKTKTQGHPRCNIKWEFHLFIKKKWEFHFCQTNWHPFSRGWDAWSGHWQSCELYVVGVWIQSFVGSLGRIPALLLLAEATSHFQAEPTSLSNHLSHIYVRVHVKYCLCGTSVALVSQRSYNWILDLVSVLLMHAKRRNITRCWCAVHVRQSCLSIFRLLHM